MGRKQFFSLVLFLAVSAPSCARAMDRAVGLIRQLIPVSQNLFERGAGFWSNPNDEMAQGFFSKLIDPSSQREDWYKVTPYVAEFWCTVSNAGFIYQGIKHTSPELLFAGVASALSHSIPKQWLLTVDKIGFMLVVSKAIRNYRMVIDTPWLLVSLSSAGALLVTDVYCARTQGMTFPHVVWHLGASYLAGIFLEHMNKHEEKDA